MTIYQAAILISLASHWFRSGAHSLEPGIFPVQEPDAATSNLIKITADLLPVHAAEPVHNVTWPDDFPAPDAYCVADESSNVARLEFDCEPDCDATQRSLLHKKTVDYSQRVKFVAIKLTNVMIGTPPQKWHNKLLVCRGFLKTVTDSGSLQHMDSSKVQQSTENITVSVPIRILFLATPRLIVYETGHEPSVSQETERFLMSGDRMTIQCKTEAFPPADRFIWWDGTTRLDERSQFLTVTHDFVGKFVRCEVHSGGKGPKSSGQVLIEKAVVPFMTDNNFQHVRETYKNSISIGSNLRLECSFGAWPYADIQWFFGNTAGSISQLSCNSPKIQQQTDSIEMGGMSYQRSNSSCLIKVNSFNQTGFYWCAGCIEIAKDSKVCDPGTNAVPHHALHLNISGAPVRSDQSTRLERPSEHSVMIYEPVCANPKPLSPDTFLQCENERIYMFDDRNGVKVQHISQMQNSPFCYEIWLSFSNLNSISRSYYCTLTVGNAIGTLQYILPIGTYIASNRTDFTSSEILTGESTAVDNTILILCIVLLASLICLGIVCAYTWNKRKACFSYRKADTNSDDFGKSNTNEDCLTIDKNGALIENGVENKDSNKVSTNGSSCQVKGGKNGYQYVSNEVVV